MDTHAPVTYYQTALPPGHSMQYPSGRTTVGISAMTPISMDSMGAQSAVYSTHTQAPPNDPSSGYSVSQYHSVSTTPVPLQLQQYQQPASAQAHLQPQQQQQQQQPQQQQYMPMQTMVSTQPHSQVQPHLQHMQQQQPHSQQLQQQQITTTMHSNPHAHAYKQPTNGQQQYMTQTQQHIQQQQHQQQTQHLQQQLQQQQYQQQHLQHHIQAQQAQQSQQQAQRQQILGPTVVTSHPTHHVQGHMQPVAHQQMHSQSSSKPQSQQHRHYQQPQQQQQQHHSQHPSHQQREHSRDHRNGNPATMEHVINPQTSTLQLAEFASVMVYTLWHTRPNINGASSNAYNVVPHRISVPPSAGPAFRKFCLKVLSATQLSSSVILLSLKYIQKLLKNNPSIHGQQGSEFRLFTVSLMLANKFLDDNTFTNKTWSDVTGISVKEINVMEMEFLNQVQFSLFVSEAEYLDWLHSLETWLKQQGQGQAQGTN
ncbi:hypothetical protein BGZ70_003210 [Mortierella alpina]|uniref:Cyclin-domain-containing protein n=1 Tax=Mortierella alpina TaxID=64518 RepID=A0A9P6IT67_MORAP|nr:hypothetical protein BGZ70_003210 [Mortierella alpina]